MDGMIVDWNAISGCDTEDAARAGLLALMCGISEECWCAGWMSGLEFSLWRAASNTHYGQGIITERQATLLRLLSEEARGWFVWDEGDEPKFISLPDWERRTAGHRYLTPASASDDS